MEVMIALYAISSLQSICDKFEDVRSFGNKIFHGFGEKVFNLILGRRNRRFEIDEFGVRDVYREYLKSDSKILRRCYSSARWTLLISGFSVAVALVAFLVLGMNDAVKPYIVLSAAPILMYVSAMLTYHAALYAYSAIDCYMSAKNISDEDVKNQQANDMALITNALDQ